MSTEGSVETIDTLCSDGCPVAPSILYDQRALMYETRKYFRGRKALTAYHKAKDRVGKGLCLQLDDSANPRRLFRHSQTYRHSRSLRRQGTISTNS
jgi:hypothetical protein